MPSNPISAAMDIAVTGAYGHLGFNLVDRLVSEGHRVRAIDVRRTAALDAFDVERIHGDVKDREAMERAFQGVEIVYHLAARISVVGDPDGSVWRTNVDGTATTARAALRAGVRKFVHVSSVHALDLSVAASPLTQDGPLARGASAPAYDRSKATAEDILGVVLDEGLDAVVVRPSGMVGPGDHDVSRMGAFVRAVRSGRLRIVATGGFDWVDVRDVVDGMVAASARATTGRRYMLGGHFMSLFDLAALIARVSGSRAPRWAVPLPVAQLAGGAGTWWARRTGAPLAPTSEALFTLRNGNPVDSAPARQELGYEPRPMEETIQDTTAWLDEIARPAR